MFRHQKPKKKFKNFSIFFIFFLDFIGPSDTIKYNIKRQKSVLEVVLKRFYTLFEGVFLSR